MPYALVGCVIFLTVLLTMRFVFGVAVVGNVFLLAALSTGFLFTALALGLLDLVVRAEPNSGHADGGLHLLPSTLLSGAIFERSLMPSRCKCWPTSSR